MTGSERGKSEKEKKISCDDKRRLGEWILLDLSLIIIPDLYSLGQLFLQ